MYFKWVDFGIPLKEKRNKQAYIKNMLTEILLLDFRTFIREE